MDMLSLVFGILALSFMISYIKVSNKLSEMTKIFLEIAMVNKFLSENLEESTESDKDIHKENFIKFLSESREWAFSYIENVQSGLESFIKEVEPSIKYFNEYGILTEGYPHHRDMKKISEEFNKLKNLLPEDLDDRR